VQKLEQEIAALEKTQADITAALEAPETYNEAGKAQQLNRELGIAVARLQAATQEWERAASEAAELEKP
jgi:ATP-binding cassette subfamily F protein 3